MTKTMSMLIATVLGLCLHIAPAQAQLARTYVSSLGSDANDCNRLTPCRTFQRAHNQALPLGEITVLDPGGYGAVTITKGISIINDGVGEAGVLVSGGAIGITIAAGASDAVTLRGLTIKGIGFGGGTGILFTDGGALTVENCTIRNLDGQSNNCQNCGTGILFAPKALAALAVTNTAVTDNGNVGIWVNPSGATTDVRGVLDHVGLYNNHYGLIITSTNTVGGVISVTVTDSVASNHSRPGFTATADANQAKARIMLQRSAAVTNATGVKALGTNAQVIVNQSLVYNNSSGWVADNGGQIFTYGNNVVAANGTDEGNMTLFAAK